MLHGSPEGAPELSVQAPSVPAVASEYLSKVELVVHAFYKACFQSQLQEGSNFSTLKIEYVCKRKKNRDEETGILKLSFSSCLDAILYFTTYSTFLICWGWKEL